MAANRLITNETVKTVLQVDKGPKAELVSFEVKDFTAKGDGFTSYVTSVLANYRLDNQELNTSYIVKLNSGKSQDMNKAVATLFRKEISFLSEVRPKLDEQLVKIGQPPLSLPKFYHSSAEFGAEFVFLEDMRLKKYRMANVDGGLDAEHAKLVLQELARLHAASRILMKHEELDSLKDKYKNLSSIYSSTENPAVGNAFSELFKANIESTASILDNSKKYAKISALLREIAPQFFDVLATTGASGPKPFQLLCHGDTWYNNFLFRYDESNHPIGICLVDHQCEAVFSIGAELSHFFYTSLPSAVRKQNMRSFLAHYYETHKSILQNVNLETGFTEEELFKEFSRSYKASLVVLSLFAPMSLQRAESTVELQDLSEENKEEKMREMKKFALTGALNSPQFKERFLDPFDEFLELGLF